MSKDHKAPEAFEVACDNTHEDFGVPDVTFEIVNSGELKGQLDRIEDMLQRLLAASQIEAKVADGDEAHAIYYGERGWAVATGAATVCVEYEIDGDVYREGDVFLTKAAAKAEADRRNRGEI